MKNSMEVPQKITNRVTISSSNPTFGYTYFLKNIFYWLCYYSCPIFLSPLFPSSQHPPHQHFSHLSSCPWVVYISSLASTFPILFSTSPCLFYAYHLCFLFPVTFPPFSPHPLPADNPPCDLHFCGSVPVLVVCLVCFVFAFVFLGSVVDSYEFVVILLFIVLIFFFFLHKSL